MINPDRSILFMEKMRERLREIPKSENWQNAWWSSVDSDILDVVCLIRNRIVIDYKDKDYKRRVADFENFIDIDSRDYAQKLKNMGDFIDSYIKEIEIEKQKHKLLLEAERHLAEASRREAVAKFKEAGLSIEEIDREREAKKSQSLYVTKTEKKD